MATVTLPGSEGALAAAASLPALAGELPQPRIVWLMLPAGDATDRTVAELTHLLKAGDIVIDGGNSHYDRARTHAAALANQGIQFVDVGTSGGIRGEAGGFSLMIGGDADTIDSLAPLFKSLAPTPDRGWGRVGPAGSGHFVKMIHNGIEYGLMQAYAEGFALLDAKPHFDLDLAQVADIWRHGSVVRSWLLELLHEILREDLNLDAVSRQVTDSGEGRWTVREAMDLEVAAPVITQALIARIKSRDDGGFSERLLSALRNRFGGHDLTPD
jgi:6-phosphogluconate dehydrogenase